MVNYPVLKDQSKRIGDNAGDAVQVVILVFAAGIFMGLFQGSGMASALAQSFATIIPKQLAGFWGLVIALVSAPGTSLSPMMVFTMVSCLFLQKLVLNMVSVTWLWHLLPSWDKPSTYLVH